MIEVLLPDGHVWLRLTQPHYDDPFDPTYARAHGGRWNPPRSWPTLYLNEDLATAQAQVAHLFHDRGIDPDDLDDAAPIELAAATLPRRQRVADVVTDEGIAAVDLPASYPVARNGRPVSHQATQPIGAEVHDRNLRGVWCRSAAGVGNELAWFPVTNAAAHPVWPAPLPFARWRHATTAAELEQSETPS